MPYNRHCYADSLQPRVLNIIHSKVQRNRCTLQQKVTFSVGLERRQSRHDTMDYINVRPKADE